MATTPRGIPLFDDDSVLTPIQAPFNAQSEALDAALEVLDGDVNSALDKFKQDLVSLPDPLKASGETFTAQDSGVWNTQAWAGIPVILDKPSWVELDFQGHGRVTGAGNYMYVDLVAEGATVIAANSDGYGATALFNQYASGTIKASSRKVVKLNSGTTTIRIATRRTVVSSGVFEVNYSVVTVTPLRVASGA